MALEIKKCFLFFVMGQNIGRKNYAGLAVGQKAIAVLVILRQDFVLCIGQEDPLVLV